jgi:hypothetical protein
MLSKIRQLFANKGKVLITGGLLVVSILTMAIGTFAWFEMDNHAAQKVELTSNGGSINVDAYAYKEGVDISNPVTTAYNKANGTSILNATKGTAPDTEGFYTVNFSSSALSGFTYGGLYDGSGSSNANAHEESIYEGNFPHVYIELRYIKPMVRGFVKGSIKNIAFAATPSGYTNMNALLDYQYRFVTVQNNDKTRYVSALTAAYADTTYTSSAWTTFVSGGSDIGLFSAAKDMTGYNYDQSLTPLDQCYVPGYNVTYNTGSSYYYSKATMIEMRVNPDKWVEYFKTNTPNDTNKLSFGITCTIAIEFSTDPYFSENKTPKIIVDKSRLNTSKGATASIGYSTYNYTTTPTVSVATANSGIATATVSGNNININTGTTTGNTRLTVTATNGTESSQATISVYVYDGPTVILSQYTLTLQTGENASVSTEYVLFDAQPTYTATSLDTAIATATVDTDGVTIQVNGVAQGNTSITVTGTYGAQTASASIAVEVKAGSDSLSYITVNTSGMKTNYLLGEPLNTTGLIVIAHRKDSSTYQVSSSEYTTIPAKNSALDSLGVTTVTVTYMTATTTFPVNVIQEAYFHLVTSLSQVVDGAKFVLGSAPQNSAKLMSTTQRVSTDTKYGTYRYSTDAIAINDSAMTIPASVQAERIIIQRVTGGFTLYSSSTTTPGYMGVTFRDGVSYGDLVTTATIPEAMDLYYTWNITINGGLATIANAQYPAQVIRFLNRWSEWLVEDPSGADIVPALFVQDSANSGPTLTLSPKTISIVAGESGVSTATLGNDAVISGVESSDPTIVTAAYSGDTVTVTGVSAGTATVNVTATNLSGSIVATLTVGVDPSTKTLQSITVTPPTNTTYTMPTEAAPLSNVLDLTGMVVTATYLDSSTNTTSTADVTTKAVVSPAAGTPITNSSQYVYVSYSFLGVTKTDHFVITVTGGNNTVSAALLTITSQPTKTEYLQNATFNSKGLEITALWSDNSSHIVYSHTSEGFTPDISDSELALSTSAGALVSGTTTFPTIGTVLVTATYTHNGATVRATFELSVISSDWTLVKNVSELVAGREIMLVTSNYAGPAFACSNVQLTYTTSTAPYKTTMSNRMGCQINVNSGINPTVTPPSDWTTYGVAEKITLGHTLDNSETWTLECNNARLQNNQSNLATPLTQDITKGYIYPGTSIHYFLSTSNTVTNMGDTPTFTDEKGDDEPWDYTWSITINPSTYAATFYSHDSYVTKRYLMYDTNTNNSYPNGRMCSYTNIYDDLFPFYIYMKPTA